MKLDELYEAADYPSYEQLANASNLLIIVNKFEERLGRLFHCNSGIRSAKKHAAIYAELQEQDWLNGRPPRPIPMFSAHLIGRAIDLSCPTVPIKELQLWFKKPTQIQLAEELGAWFEDFQYCNGWVHMQNRAPKSGKRFFIPF